MQFREDAQFASKAFKSVRLLSKDFFKTLILAIEVTRTFVESATGRDKDKHKHYYCDFILGGKTDFRYCAPYILFASTA